MLLIIRQKRRFCVICTRASQKLQNNIGKMKGLGKLVLKGRKKGGNKECLRIKGIGKFGKDRKRGGKREESQLTKNVYELKE